MKTIDLGIKLKEGIYLESLEPQETRTESKMHYPALYVGQLDPDKAKSFPKVGSKGKATIDFNILSRTMYENSKNGKDRCCLEMEIRSITFDDESKSNRPRTIDEDEDYIEKGLAEEEKNSEEEKNNEKDNGQEY